MISLQAIAALAATLCASLLLLAGLPLRVRAR
jgi:hypothetical protein